MLLFPVRDLGIMLVQDVNVGPIDTCKNTLQNASSILLLGCMKHVSRPDKTTINLELFPPADVTQAENDADVAVYSRI